MRSALATTAERRVVCDSFAGKTTEVLDLHVAHHLHGALPLTPERHHLSRLPAQRTRPGRREYVQVHCLSASSCEIRFLTAILFVIVVNQIIVGPMRSLPSIIIKMITHARTSGQTDLPGGSLYL